MDELAIHTQNLTRDFGSVRAVADLNLDVPSGVVFGLLGSQGAGKTTVVRLLLGLLAPTTGSASVLGFDTQTQGDEVRLRTGVVLARTGLYHRLTAHENLDFYGRIWHLSTYDRNSRVKSLLTTLGLWDRREERIETWPRSLRQRLALARALLHRPQLLILDEPLAGLDAVDSGELLQMVKDLSIREGITVFIASQKIAETAANCSHVALMKDGRLLRSGPVSSVTLEIGGPILEISGRGFSDDVISLLAKRREVQRVGRIPGGIAVELKGEVDTAPLVSLLVESSVEVMEVRRRAADLQDPFRMLVGREDGRE